MLTLARTYDQLTDAAEKEKSRPVMSRAAKVVDVMQPVTQRRSKVPVQTVAADASL